MIYILYIDIVRKWQQSSFQHDLFLSQDKSASTGLKVEGLPGRWHALSLIWDRRYNSSAAADGISANKILHACKIFTVISVMGIE